MKEPIYEEINPVETDTVAAMEQPIYEEMKPMAPEGSEPMKEAAIEEEEEWGDGVQILVEDLENEGLYWRLIANLLEICHSQVSENCCSHCGEIAWYQEHSWLREAAVKEVAGKKSGQDGEEEEGEEEEEHKCVLKIS
ncbi:UNVERIFIED_CONTAM: hypothetical protein K2H54_048042 [Gekko kuhli]